METAIRDLCNANRLARNIVLKKYSGEFGMYVTVVFAAKYQSMLFSISEVSKYKLSWSIIYSADGSHIRYCFREY
jgi:hypothetical protein